MKQSLFFFWENFSSGSREWNFCRRRRRLRWYHCRSLNEIEKNGLEMEDAGGRKEGRRVKKSTLHPFKSLCAGRRRGFGCNFHPSLLLYFFSCGRKIEIAPKAAFLSLIGLAFLWLCVRINWLFSPSVLLFCFSSSLFFSLGYNVWPGSQESFSVQITSPKWGRKEGKWLDQWGFEIGSDSEKLLFILQARLWPTKPWIETVSWLTNSPLIN